MSASKKPPTGPIIPDLEIGAPRRLSGAPDVRTSAAPAPGISAKPEARVSEAPDSASRAPQGAPSKAPAAAPAPPRSVQDYFGSGTFDEDHFGDGGPSLALDTGDPGPPRSGPAVHFGDGPSLPGASDGEDLELYETSSVNAEAARGVESQPFDRRQWPTGRTPDSASLRIDPVEVKLAADYGEAPSLVFVAPAYTARVLTRQRALRAKTAELSRAFESAAKRRDDLLVQLVQERRGKILMTDEGEALFEPIVALERVALERRAALSGTNADYDRLTSELGVQIEQLEREAAAQDAVVAERKAALADLARSFDRVEAKRKRLYIELTGLVALSEKSGGKLTPEQSARVARLEADILAQKPELDAAEKALGAGKAVVTAAEEDLRRIEARGRDLEKKRRTVDEDFQKQIGARSEGVAEAEAERLTAFAEVGRRVLAEKGRLVDVDSAALEAISRADEALLARLVELEKHVRALDAYDRTAFKQGVAVAAGGLVLVLLGVLLAAR